MKEYMLLAAGMVLLPLIYWVTVMVYRPAFQEDKNRQRRPLCSPPEIAVTACAEAALIGIWRSGVFSAGSSMRFQLLFVMLAAMTVICMTDLWERVVPNSILLILLFLFVIIIGLQGVKDMDVVLKALPSILLGFLFCALSFGLCYLISKRNMGAGDVKLALVMGLYLTGEYVVGAVLYGCIAAAVFSIVQLIRKRVSRKDTLPFVPFLYIGLVISYLAG